MSNIVAPYSLPTPFKRDEVLRHRARAARVERAATWCIGIFVLGALGWSASAMLIKAPGVLLNEALVGPLMVLLALNCWLTVWHSSLVSKWGPETNFDRMARLYLLVGVSPNAREFVDAVVAQDRIISRTEVNELFQAYGKLADEELARRFGPPRAADAAAQR